MNRNLQYFKILNALNSSRKIVPNEILLRKLEDKALFFLFKKQKAQKNFLLMIAASLMLLVCLNFSVLILMNTSNDFCSEVHKDNPGKSELILVKGLYYE